MIYAMTATEGEDCLLVPVVVCSLNQTEVLRKRGAEAKKC